MKNVQETLKCQGVMTKPEKVSQMTAATGAGVFMAVKKKGEDKS